MSDSYLQDLQASIKNGSTPPAPEFLNEDLVNTFLYIPLPYRPTNYTPEEDRADRLLENFTA